MAVLARISGGMASVPYNWPAIGEDPGGVLPAQIVSGRKRLKIDTSSRKTRAGR